MRKMNVSKTVKKLVQDIDKNNILFNHPIQRKSEQWTIEQKSLLIHSLISDYPVPPLYSVRDEEENKYSILDGKQRLTIISDFFHGQWKLIKDMPTVWVENVEYDISGLTFKELNEEVKEELEDASLLMYIFNDCSDEEIEEIFYRLNNGTALTQDQKTRAKLGEDLLTFVDEILKTNFFKTKAYFSSYQLKKSEDQTCILQTLMLLNGYNFRKFGNEDIQKFIKQYRNEDNKTELELCKNLFNKLDECFIERNKLIKKTNIPMFIMTLKASNDLEISFDKFKEWINYFIKNYNDKKEYDSNCNRNTTNKEKVKRRLELMQNDFIEYVSMERNNND